MSAASVKLLARLARAKKHFDDLQLAITGQTGDPSGIDTILVEHDLQRETYVITVGNVTEPPPEWSIMAGEIIHQLRSVLDNIVCYMAIKNGKPATSCERTEFPIRATNSADTKGVLNDKVKKFVHPAAFTAIKKLQPYNRAEPYRDPLWAISKLDIIDKHRTLVIVDKRVKIEAATLTNGVRTKRVQFPTAKWHRPVKGAKLFELRSAGAGAEVQMHPEARRVVAFDQTGTNADNRSVLGMLHKYIRTVEDVVADFESKHLI